MSDLFDTQEPPATTASNGDVLPESWASILVKIPPIFREALTKGAQANHDALLDKLREKSGHHVHDAITAETTVMASLSGVVFMPLHLIAPDKVEEINQLLERSNGTQALWQWLKDAYPNADTLLVLGDQPNPEQFEQVLDETLSNQPAKTLVCGPGATIEPLLRSYGEPRNYLTYGIQSMDERKGAGWNQAPGPALEKKVDDLLRQHKPNRAIVFEPAQMPATHLMAEKCQALGVPLERIEAQSLTKKMKP